MNLDLNLQAHKRVSGIYGGLLKGNVLQELNWIKFVWYRINPLQLINN